MIVISSRRLFQIQKSGAQAGRKGKRLFGHFWHDGIEVHTIV
jgi:hypothetical protein